MNLSTLIIISCILSAVATGFLALALLFIFRFAGRGVTALFGGLFGGNDKDNRQNQPTVTPLGAQAAGAAGNLRQRANQVDFDAAFSRYAQQNNPHAAQVPAAGQASSQTAPAQQQTNQFGHQGRQFGTPLSQQARLSPRTGTQFSSQQNPQAPQSGGQRPSTPSLSPPRPLQGGFPQPNNPQAPSPANPLQQNRSHLSQGRQLNKQFIPRQGGSLRNRNNRGRDSGLRDDYDRIYDDGDDGGGFLDDFGL